MSGNMSTTVPPTATATATATAVAATRTATKAVANKTDTTMESQFPATSAALPHEIFVGGGSMIPVSPTLTSTPALTMIATAKVLKIAGIG